MKKNNEIIMLDLKPIHETEKAYLVENLKEQKVWIPKSQCDSFGNEFQLPEWLALEKGLI